MNQNDQNIIKDELKRIEYSNGREDADRKLSQICMLACKEASNLEVSNPYAAAILYTIADLAEMSGNSILEDRKDIERALESANNLLDRTNSENTRQGLYEKIRRLESEISDIEGGEA